MIGATTSSPSTQRLRVGIDFHTFDGIYQGSRSHLIGLYREAIRQAPDIDFFFFLERPEVLRDAYGEFAERHVQLIAMPHRPGIWRLGWQLAQVQRRHRLDALHVQFRLPFVPQGPCICTIHDVLFESHPAFFGRGFVRMARWSARHAVRRATFTLTVSRWSRDEIARRYGIDAQRIVLTPNAVDPARFHPGSDGGAVARWGLTPGAYIGTLGRLEPRKNHATLVRAYARLGEVAPPLVIIGQRDFAYHDVFELIQSLRLNGRVRILEDVDDACLPALLRGAFVMVYPSFAEGFGMPVLEALASGVPVITSNTTALPEVAGPSGTLVDPNDVDALVLALRASLDEPPSARALRIAEGIRHAATFSWQASAATLLDALRAAFTARRQPRPSGSRPARPPVLGRHLGKL